MRSRTTSHARRSGSSSTSSATSRTRSTCASTSTRRTPRSASSPRCCSRAATATSRCRSSRRIVSARRSAVAALARRIGLSIRRSRSSARSPSQRSRSSLVQASSALNDLVRRVVPRYRGRASRFDSGRRLSSCFALALGLAVGTKFTALLALPDLGARGGRRPARAAPGLVLALAGLRRPRARIDRGTRSTSRDRRARRRARGRRRISGSTSDGAALSRHSCCAAPSIIVDMSGAPQVRTPRSSSQSAVCPCGGQPRIRRRSVRLKPVARRADWRTRCIDSPSSVMARASLTTSASTRVVQAWAATRRPGDTLRSGPAASLNDHCGSAAVSWFGPTGVLCLLVVRRRSRHPAAGTQEVWTPVDRGRSSRSHRWILLSRRSRSPSSGTRTAAASSSSACALAAATWGVFARSRASRPRPSRRSRSCPLGSRSRTTWAKPSGLGEIWPPRGAAIRIRQTRSGAPREHMLRPGCARSRSREVLSVGSWKTLVPADASGRGRRSRERLPSPYFGVRGSRATSTLVELDGGVPDDAEWLVVHPDDAFESLSGRVAASEFRPRPRLAGRAPRRSRHVPRAAASALRRG